MRTKVRAALNEIQKVLDDTDWEDSKDLWMILTAIRGSDREFHTKLQTTAKLRAIAFPYLRLGLYADFNYDPLALEILEVAEFLGFGNQLNLHFLYRFLDAVRAIRAKD